MVNLYLIRHGKQNTDLCNIDVELSTEGILQAELLRDRMKNYEIDALYSSSMLRARQTAEIINKELWLPIKIRDEIREICFGNLEGRSDEYNDTHYSDFYRKQMDMVEDVPYPGGENGTNVYERTMPVIQELVQCGRKNIAVVTHGGVIRALLAALIGKNQAKRNLFAVSLENTSITQLVYQPERDRFYLQRFNDYAHLEGHPELYRKHI